MQIQPGEVIGMATAELPEGLLTELAVAIGSFPLGTAD